MWTTLYRYVGLSMGNHTKSTYVKNAWAKLRDPNVRMLKVCFGWLKPNLNEEAGYKRTVNWPIFRDSLALGNGDNY